MAPVQTQRACDFVVLFAIELDSWVDEPPPVFLLCCGASGSCLVALPVAIAGSGCLSGAALPSGKCTLASCSEVWLRGDSLFNSFLPSLVGFSFDGAAR